jgi:hypothetical protein
MTRRGYAMSCDGLTRTTAAEQHPTRRSGSRAVFSQTCASASAPSGAGGISPKRLPTGITIICGPASGGRGGNPVGPQVRRIAAWTLSPTSQTIS